MQSNLQRSEPMRVNQRVRAIFRAMYARMGVGLIPYNVGTSNASRVGRILASRQITTVLDVGGNEGQFGLWLREIGYQGGIISVEPGPQAHAILVRTAAEDGNWQVLPPLALGDAEGNAEFNITRNSQCSSFLRADQQADGIPDFEVVERRSLRVTTLARLVEEQRINADGLYLKLDVQGFEMNVLRGGGEWLANVPAIQLEASAAPIYAGEPGILELSEYLLKRGFRFGTIHPMLVDAHSGCMEQCDIVYVRAGTN